MSIRTEAYETRVSEKWFIAVSDLRLGDLRAVISACEGMPDGAFVEVGKLTASPDRERVSFGKVLVRSEQAA
ncbi:hypothetical protein [Nocardia sp. NPDC049707]|uniref:hypothetical protein n=1 Tax=Nocardia sp. NPDC049707 TaxID=3154735 RepID=UPI00344147E2